MKGRCLNVKNECKIMEDLKKESYDRGMKKAAFDVAARYYRMGLISLQEAAEDTGMQLEEFAAEATKISSYGCPIPVCKAIQDIMDKSRQEGRAEGEQTQAKSTVLRMYAKGKSLDEIADDVGFDVETVKGWLSASNS